ncbi:MAG: hypothetical protein P9X22_03570 [Candidatus Zapsychrus exili]|nr:hypothetical protein [Candidatus Zapsychrus exili]
MSNKYFFSKVCPYFKDNQCGSEYLSEIKLGGLIVPLCDTNEHEKCPIFIESRKREKDKK